MCALGHGRYHAAMWISLAANRCEYSEESDAAWMVKCSTDDMKQLHEAGTDIYLKYRYLSDVLKAAGWNVLQLE